MTLYIKLSYNAPDSLEFAAGYGILLLKPIKLKDKPVTRQSPIALRDQSLSASFFIHLW
jgi:hypothetical protein